MSEEEQKKEKEVGETEEGVQRGKGEEAEEGDKT